MSHSHSASDFETSVKRRFEDKKCRRALDCCESWTSAFPELVGENGSHHTVQTLSTKSQSAATVEKENGGWVTTNITYIFLEYESSLYCCSCLMYSAERRSLPFSPTHLCMPGKWGGKKKSVFCPFPFQLLIIAGAPRLPLGTGNAHLKNHPDVHGGCQPHFLMQ